MVPADRYIFGRNLSTDAFSIIISRYLQKRFFDNSTFIGSFQGQSWNSFNEIKVMSNHRWLLWVIIWFSERHHHRHFIDDSFIENFLSRKTVSWRTLKSKTKLFKEKIKKAKRANPVPPVWKRNPNSRHEIMESNLDDLRTDINNLGFGFIRFFGPWLVQGRSKVSVWEKSEGFGEISVQDEKGI